MYKPIRINLFAQILILLPLKGTTRQVCQHLNAADFLIRQFSRNLGRSEFLENGLPDVGPRVRLALRLAISFMIEAIASCTRGEMPTWWGGRTAFIFFIGVPSNRSIFDCRPFAPDHQ